MAVLAGAATVADVLIASTVGSPDRGATAVAAALEVRVVARGLAAPEALVDHPGAELLGDNNTSILQVEAGALTAVVEAEQVRSRILPAGLAQTEQ